MLDCRTTPCYLGKDRELEPGHNNYHIITHVSTADIKSLLTN
jgi:hypothetical protein